MFSQDSLEEVIDITLDAAYYYFNLAMKYVEILEAEYDYPDQEFIELLSVYYNIIGR